MELFVFTHNKVFESVYQKGMSKIPLFFEVFLWLHQVQTRGDLIPHVVHISGTRIIEAGIDGPLRLNNLGGIMIGVNPLKSYR